MRKISSDQAQVGSELAYSNATRLLDAAKLAANAGSYGIGLSMSILAAEEAAKSVYLKVLAIQVFEVEPLLVGIFTAHAKKHSLMGVTVALLHLMDIFFTAKKDVQELIDTGQLDEANAGKEYGARAIEALNRERATSLDQRKFITWYREANALKNTGFYVDWRQNAWQDPAAISLEKFDEYMEYVEHWFSQVDMLHAVPMNELRASYKEFSENMKDKSGV